MDRRLQCLDLEKGGSEEKLMLLLSIISWGRRRGKGKESIVGDVFKFEE